MNSREPFYAIQFDSGKSLGWKFHLCLQRQEGGDLTRADCFCKQTETLRSYSDIELYVAPRSQFNYVRYELAVT
jgi:hypothetical protein